MSLLHTDKQHTCRLHTSYIPQTHLPHASYIPLKSSAYDTDFRLPGGNSNLERSCKVNYDRTTVSYRTLKVKWDRTTVCCLISFIGRCRNEDDLKIEINNRISCTNTYEMLVWRCTLFIR